MALLLTLLMLVLLTLEVAIIGLTAVRDLGDESTLLTRNLAARRAAESAINRLDTSLNKYLNNTGTPIEAETWFAPGGGGAIANQALTLDNPDGSTTITPISLSAYIKERRGNLLPCHRQGHRWRPRSGAASMDHDTALSGQYSDDSVGPLYEQSHRLDVGNTRF